MLRRHSLLAIVATLAATGLAAVASAQRSFDDDRYDDPGGSREDKRADRNVPGEFDYYALVMSWSPTYCADSGRDGYDMQCDRNDGRRYAFVLHGLWPQYERGYPEACRTRRKPFVPQPVIDGMLDIMPSPRLVIHEYKKHGTCSGLDPAGYYEISRKLFREIRIPERYVNPQEAQFVSPEELEDELIEENPELEPEMISVVCGGAGKRLKEVRVCFTKEGQLRACGSNEEQRRLCSIQSHQKMYVPPVRSSRTEPDTPEDRERLKRSEPPSRPKVIQGVTGR
jgi:ribonuclease T2